jgi:hypothetical protein
LQFFHLQFAHHNLLDPLRWICICAARSIRLSYRHTRDRDRRRSQRLTRHQCSCEPPFCALQTCCSGLSSAVRLIAKWMPLTSIQTRSRGRTRHLDSRYP